MLVTHAKQNELTIVSHVQTKELHVDDLWRARVRAKMKEMGVGQAQLAKHVECAQGNISQILSFEKSQSSSIHAQRISIALDVELTLQAQAELIFQQIVDADEKVARSVLDNWATVAKYIRTNKKS